MHNPILEGSTVSVARVLPKGTRRGWWRGSSPHTSTLSRPFWEHQGGFIGGTCDSNCPSAENTFQGLSKPHPPVILHVLPGRRRVMVLGLSWHRLDWKRWPQLKCYLLYHLLTQIKNMFWRKGIITVVGSNVCFQYLSACLWKRTAISTVAKQCRN